RLGKVTRCGGAVRDRAGLDRARLLDELQAAGAEAAAGDERVTRPDLAAVLDQPADDQTRRDAGDIRQQVAQPHVARLGAVDHVRHGIRHGSPPIDTGAGKPWERTGAAATSGSTGAFLAGLPPLARIRL